jgi:hypothetical protein
VTGLAPAGAEAVSMQAAAAFAAEAAAMPAAHAAAQEELMRAGAALIEVARMYEQVDVEAAGTLVSSANQFTSQAFATDAASVGAGLARAEALPGALGSAARTPLMANLIEGVAASNPSTTLPAAANAASTVMRAGSAPLSSISPFTSMGGAAGGSAAGVPISLTGEEESTRDDADDQQTNDQQTNDQQPGEQLV